jgi:NAD(P)-dependent dehydrogenase (short-subunit alcohol dehydrogenase family)
MAELQDRIAIVTGASSGIGRASALRFAEAGARVVCADVDEPGGEETVRLIAEAGGAAVFQRTDVADRAQAEALVQRALDEYGGLDVAFNNAGTEGTMAPTADATDEVWDRTIAVNLTGVFYAMRAQIPAMRARGGGSIVNCASIAGLVGFPNLPAYVASKHGVVGMTKTTALELAPEGIRVNALCPGVIDTPMVDRATGHDAEAKGGYAAAEPVHRLGRAEEMADVALWLCSERSSFVTGQAIAADGGWTAQ